jgi:hypothetical protein
MTQKECYTAQDLKNLRYVYLMELDKRNISRITEEIRKLYDNPERLVSSKITMAFDKLLSQNVCDYFVNLGYTIIVTELPASYGRDEEGYNYTFEFQ